VFRKYAVVNKACIPSLSQPTVAQPSTCSHRALGKEETALMIERISLAVKGLTDVGRTEYDNGLLMPTN
jgi:hypothetical protein